jgi:thymidine kinase
MNSKCDYKGEIQIIMGSMFSGKSTEMGRRMNNLRWVYGEENLLLIKKSGDKRSGDDGKIKFHDGRLQNAIPCNKLMDIYQTAIKYKCIGIDDGQFFEDIIKFSTKMANLGKIIIIAALDGNYLKKPYPILDLIPEAEYVVKLSSICRYCKSEKGAFSLYFEGEAVGNVYGGDDLYAACCRKCYHEKMQELKIKFDSSKKSKL